MGTQKELNVVRYAILVFVVSGMPIGAFLNARFDQLSLALFLLAPLSLIASVISAVVLAVKSFRKKISPIELVVFVLILILVSWYASSGHPFTVGREANFRSLEDRLDQFVRSVQIDSVGPLESLILPRELAESIRAAVGKRYEDGTIRVDIITGGAGGYIYLSEDSAVAQADLDDWHPNRWTLNEHWEAYRR
ncbi:MAG: hypothetical protein IH856_25070 [Deltaproteobacteria bacterium]|nr:hypothetical protein [Deltaproteobacteria bacterium]